MKNFKEEIVGQDEILKIVSELEEDKTVKDLRKDYPDQNKKLEEALLNYVGENDLKSLRTEFPENKWNYLTKKIAYQYE